MEENIHQLTLNGRLKSGGWEPGFRRQKICGAARSNGATAEFIPVPGRDCNPPAVIPRQNSGPDETMAPAGINCLLFSGGAE
jgi:hypothetical protein